MFALAFGIDALARAALSLARFSAELEPVFYCTRLLTFALIISATAIKNRARNR